MSSFFEKLGGFREEEMEREEEGEGEGGGVETEGGVENSSYPVLAAAKKIKIQKEESQTAETKRESKEAEQEGEGQLALDVYQTDSDIIIKSAVAGVKPEDLDIEITNDMVTIRGERENEEKAHQDNYYYQECYWGKFSRSVVLPVEVDADRAEASFKNGILTLRLPKFERTMSKKLKIKSAD